MLIMKKHFLLICIALWSISCRQSPNKVTSTYDEPFRLQYHFSPESHWMNDPNGLVYNGGVYHMFYQYYPEDVVWGPMHWGHATSKDLVHWEHKPIALYPDSLGYVFSGSAILDSKNSSGFGIDDNPPLVAAYTIFDPVKADAKAADNQTQGMAYSLDHGDSWTKYENNPIIPNLDFEKDFRDPKLFWNEQISAWTIALVGGDHVQFWKSTDLRAWEKMSSFGKDSGAHGGVWECPDLFELKVEGSEESKWVMLVSINPGAPSGGSGTQYFIGDFDGVNFTSDQTAPRWIDGGSDNYAGITYNDEPNGDRIFIGWMSNWDYAQDIPTSTWRSSMTMTRKMALRDIDGTLTLCSLPVSNYKTIIDQQATEDLTVYSHGDKKIRSNHLATSKIQLQLTAKAILKFENEKGEKLIVELDPKGKLAVDRTQSGLVDFKDNFSRVNQMNFAPLDAATFEIYLDASSIEIFVQDGRAVMTSRQFNTANFSAVTIVNNSDDELEVKDFAISPIRSIW